MRPISDTNGKPQKRVIDLDDLIRRGEIVDNIVLRPDDIVYIPPTLTGRLGYYVQNILSPTRSVQSLGSSYSQMQYGGGFGFTGQPNNFNSGNR